MGRSLLISVMYNEIKYFMFDIHIWGMESLVLLKGKYVTFSQLDKTQRMKKIDYSL